MVAVWFYMAFMWFYKVLYGFKFKLFLYAYMILYVLCGFTCHYMGGYIALYAFYIVLLWIPWWFNQQKWRLGIKPTKYEWDLTGFNQQTLGFWGKINHGMGMELDSNGIGYDISYNIICCVYLLFFCLASVTCVSWPSCAASRRPCLPFNVPQLQDHHSSALCSEVQGMAFGGWIQNFHSLQTMRTMFHQELDLFEGRKSLHNPSCESTVRNWRDWGGMASAWCSWSSSKRERVGHEVNQL